MKKRLLSLLLTLMLVISAGTNALAAPRITNFFTTQPHIYENFSDMEYDPVLMDEVWELADETRGLMKDQRNIHDVRECMEIMSSCVYWMVSMVELTYIHTVQDVESETARANYVEATETLHLLQEEYRLLIRDLLHSPCSSIFDDAFSPELREFYMNYETESEEMLKERTRLTELEEDYWEAAGRHYASVKEMNAALGPIFLEIMKVRKTLEEAAGYDDYPSYAYEAEFYRDYTPEEAAAFADEIKDSILPVYLDVLSLYQAETYREGLDREYGGETILAMLHPCVEKLSSEMAESFEIMQKHGLHDVDRRKGMSDQGFTSVLSAWHLPFLYFSLGGYAHDVTGVIHEFGHFNDTYWSDPDYDLAGGNKDIMEVPSQALELLFLRFYPEFFGEEDAEAMSLQTLTHILHAIVDGARQDEFLQEVYTMKSPTLSKINEAYGRISREYGYNDEDEQYRWVEYPHSFEVPFYYISYATSAAGALQLWTRSREDYFKGVDDYLRFTALSEELGFQESFEEMGLTSPLEEGAMEKLADQVRKDLDVDNKLKDLPAVGYFRDVKEKDWYRDAVAFVYENGLMNGMSVTAFQPGGEMTRAQLVTTLYRTEGEPSVSERSSSAPFRDVDAGSWYGKAVNWAASEGIVNGLSDTRFGPGEKVTREQLATILFRYMTAEDRWETEDGSSPVSKYTDAASISPWAEESMNWALSRSIIRGTTETTLSPGSTATRAQVATILMRITAEN